MSLARSVISWFRNAISPAAVRVGHRVDEAPPERRRALERLELREHRVDLGVAAVADRVHRLAQARHAGSPDPAAAVEAGHVLVQLALLVARPRRRRRRARSRMNCVRCVAAEVVAVVRGRRLVVPVRHVALGGVDRLGHGDDLVHLEGVAGRRASTPHGASSWSVVAVVRGDAARLLGAAAARDEHDVLDALLAPGIGSGSSRRAARGSSRRRRRRRAAWSRWPSRRRPPPSTSGFGCVPSIGSSFSAAPRLREKPLEK